MHQIHAPGDTALLVTREGRDRPARAHRRAQPEPTWYKVQLTGEDLHLLQVCSAWICRLEPAPDIRARFVHLEQQLACAQPVRTKSHPAA